LNVCFLAGVIASFFKSIWLFFTLLLLLAKVLIEFPFVNSVAIFFGRQYLMKYFPFLQPLHIGYTIIAGWLGKFGHYEWKGRRINK
jgi:biofilm PGA synthesis N-glycosyltransferase PgaC